MDSSRGWAWMWAHSSQARFQIWPSPTHLGSNSPLLSPLSALLWELCLTHWPSSPSTLPLIRHTSGRTAGTWMIPWSHFWGPARLRLGDLILLLLLLQLPHLHLHQHQPLSQHPPAPPLRAQTPWYRCCRAFTRDYAWWCKAFITWLSIGPSLAWRISWPRWPGQEFSLLLWGEVRLL